MSGARYLAALAAAVGRRDAAAETGAVLAAPRPRARFEPDPAFGDGGLVATEDDGGGPAAQEDRPWRGVGRWSPPGARTPGGPEGDARDGDARPVEARDDARAAPFRSPMTAGRDVIAPEAPASGAKPPAPQPAHRTAPHPVAADAATPAPAAPGPVAAGHKADEEGQVRPPAPPKAPGTVPSAGPAISDPPIPEREGAAAADRGAPPPSPAQPRVAQSRAAAAALPAEAPRRPADAPAPPPLLIEIGHIEIRLTDAAIDRRPPAPAPRPVSPGPSLDEFLNSPDNRRTGR